MIDKVFGGRYRLTEKIGVGGMAEVYKATDEVLGRTVAVKVMLPHYASDPTFAARFKQEAQAAANLQSPYIVNIYDWGSEASSGSLDGTYYIVMEYVRGIDLKTAIEQRGSINQRKVAEIGSQVCAALNVAHGYDIIHRDIKPHNIMVQPDGNSKVMDFGIARANNANLTQTGSVLGTAYYVSPEQAQGKPLTPATDIYSLGVCLYEASTGRVPFDGPDPVSIALKQVSELPVPPRQINPDIDPAFEAIVLRALEKDPAQRFATTEQMRIALNDYLAGRSSSVVSSSARTQVIGAGAVVPLGTTDAEAAGMPADGTAVMPSLINGSAGTGAGAGNGKINMPPKKNRKRVGIIIGVVALIAIILALFFIFKPFGLFASSEQVTVPNMIGKSQTEAERMLKGNGLEVGTIIKTTDASIAEGNVISHDPVADTKVAKGSKVDLVISSGVETVDMPDLVGMTQAEAEAKLKELGFSYTIREVGSDEVEKGRVSAQSVKAGEKTETDTRITIDISTGPNKANIPNVYGMERSAAVSALEGAGFKVTISEDYSSEVRAGSVIAQSKTGEGQKGETIALTISKGPAPTPVDVPDVSGLSRDAAVTVLTNKGLAYSYANQPSAGQVVISQSPASGKVDKGTTVTLTFGDPT